MDEQTRSENTRKEIDVFANLRPAASPKLLEFLDQMLIFFPEEFRYRLKQVVDSLPREGDNMQKILEVVRAQWRDIQFQKWVRIVVTGPSQTGKTSLLQALNSSRSSEVEPIFSVVETPGLEEFLGYDNEFETTRRLREADLILLVLDARYEVSELTGQIFERLKGLGTPILVVLNKVDELEEPGRKVKAAKAELGVSVLPTSIYRPETIDGLINAMVAASPKILYPLARSFPQFRRTLCRGIVTQAALAGGVVGIVPIPVSDLLPITAIQTAMILKIARAFGCELNRERARELLPTLVAGILVREGGHRLRQRFPHKKELIAVALGGGWTFALGRIAVRYFEGRTGVLAGRNIPRNVYAMN